MLRFINETKIMGIIAQSLSVTVLKDCTAAIELGNFCALNALIVKGGAV